MSAIAGFVRLDGGAAEELDGAAMMAALEGAVADDTRTRQAGPAFFGCRIRWLSPESRGERMPDGDTEGRFMIAADAVLDNREELFARLQVPRFRRADITDSELIVLAYRRWGRRSPEFLLGDFAFALWDAERRELFAARDLLGTRTLYYSQGGGRLAFATTIAPLLALPGASPRLDEMWLAEFLAIPEMFESTDPEATPYVGVRQVPPGHGLFAAGGAATATTSSYGRGALEPDVPLRLKSDAEYEEAFREVVGEAVRCRLRTFREVGATLSGGLDSGTVAAFAARELRREGKVLHGYSSVPPPGFADWTSRAVAADERPYIRATAGHVGNISEAYLSFEGTSPLAEVDEWLDLLETPYKFFENSYWLRGIHELAGRSGTGVLLTGARGNFTVSWGPALEYYAMLFKRMRWRRLAAELTAYGRHKGVGRRRLLSAVGRTAFPALLAGRGEAPAPGLPELLLRPEFAARTGVLERLRGGGPAAAGPLELRREKLGSLAAANKNGATATKLSLRYGAQERDPTGDVRVIRFCLSVPFEQYVQGGRDRALIRRATAGLLPDEVRLNQRVRGVQGADWLHRTAPAWPRLLEEISHLCSDPLAASYLHVARIRQAAEGIGRAPTPELAFHPEVRLLMRSLIVYRFLKRFA
ncbi:asparagine synthase-related protein [Cohnella fermenti]|uniref:asparagine synthase (glutamine-hydrolyzing) n=1 Tax=Cohnella fermenti TaxID=2565925 RepID=A0A4S4BHB4_9BACL|nr:asparagine synthase-related protein [Cohnella fermenti]THF73668.1 asparagine synthetase B [Cohnella fermenti]